ncbi:ATP-binding protein [bacterium]|nr:ATP-binding protein [bacterium]
MLVEFLVENFKSIAEEQYLSMVATSNKKSCDNAVQYQKMGILKGAAIYGSNASGKTNLLQAFKELQNLVVYSTDLKLDQSIPTYKPHKLDKKWENAPARFEMEFINKVRYKLEITFDRKNIIHEKITFYPKKQPALLYERNYDQIKYGHSFKGNKKNIESGLLPNTLFLSKAANSNHEQLREIYRYIRKINFRLESHENLFGNYFTTCKIEEDECRYKEKIKEFLIAADIGISNIHIKKQKTGILFPAGTPPEEQDRFKETLSKRPQMEHKIFENDSETGRIYFDIAEESNGTIKMYDLAGPILDALEKGEIIVIDELDSSFHPYLSSKIMRLFNSCEDNPNGAQIIVTTHDVNIMNQKILTRDQMWITAKDQFGKTKLYSIDEFDKKEVRANIPFGKWYLNGRFGGVPKLRKWDWK